MIPTGAIVRGWWREMLGALLVLVSRILTAPRTPWENDEFLFAEAVKNFDPSRYHPHPPGYPLLVILGKALNAFVHDPWRALVIVSIVSAPIGFVALARAFRNWIGDADLAVCGALLYYFSASMLVHGTLALSDGPAMMFVALAFLAISTPHNAEHERTAIAIGLWTSAAIGTRPQLLVPIAPLLVIALLQMRTMRQRVACGIAFVLLSLFWFLPLADAAGGIDALRLYETKQMQYVAAHDATMSRGGMSTAMVAVRFLFHPWGWKYVTLPLFACVLFGLIPFAVLLRRDKLRSTLLGLLAFALVQLVFELGWMDPADGARYSLAFMPLIALLAALGFGVIRRSVGFATAPWAVTAVLAAATLVYVWPLIGTRSRVPSPPAAAAAWADSNLAPNSVIGYDTALKPHAEYLLARFRLLPIEMAIAATYDHPEIPLVVLTNGGAHAAGSQVFSWPASDAYWKLTRDLYREVTLEREAIGDRYLPLRGAYAIEHTKEGAEWRWLGPDATIRLPQRHGDAVVLTLRITPDTPYAADDVTVSLNDRLATVIRVGKEPLHTRIALPPDPRIDIRLRSSLSFRPSASRLNQDPRTLAVQLMHVQSGVGLP